MRAPVLNRKLVLESPVSTPDGAGGFAKTWASLGTIWADVQPGAGKELAGIEVKVSSVSYLITVRGAAEGSPQRPKAGQRFSKGTRRFEILAVTEADAEGRHLKCYAREEVAP
jgi:SPP1 family predicted phage head-tail adaptor